MGYFQQWIKDYQQQLVPAHLSGLMRVGYWDNKVSNARSDYHLMSHFPGERHS